ncbi:hypothetical protein KOR42_09630 [Thalassoglobus neptunius]|uniref:Uncharacterized protein n=1 Tax=Thalassoglobus neptunius TaxID=1938619 RepID=A0A5C5X5K3_9PLAN|nr:hypothetical protein [Thalassoglobus neptunius]TWT57601.1 hypothetical protein KOR42_09630 [Thalassoglobus neptunius]
MSSEWLSRAVNVFKRDVPETPQPFDVECECGQRHTGLRRVRFQHLVCKSCGGSLFILPRDSYPPPLDPAKRKKRRKKRRSKRRPKENKRPTPLDFSQPDEVEIPASEDSSPNSAPKPASNKKLPKEVYEEDPGPGFIIRQIEGTVGFVSAFRDAFLGFWSPHRKIGLLIFCLLAATVFYSIRRSTLAQAEIDAREKFAAAIDLIAEERWSDAKAELKDAVEAVDRLGRTDREASQIRQMHSEIQAFTGLSQYTLFELTEDAEKTYVAEGMEAWQERFRIRYQDEWLIIEGNLRPVHSYQGQNGSLSLELEFPWVVGDRPREVSVLVDFPLAKGLPVVSSEPYDDSPGQYSIFAAQIEDCSLGLNGNWIVRLNPRTAFFWSDEKTYRQTNLNVGSILSQEELEHILAQQAKWMGVRD